MRLKTRLHEWLAERVSWIQYPDTRRGWRRPTLVSRYRNMSGKQRGWLVFAIFWTLVVALSIYGNSIT